MPASRVCERDLGAGGRRVDERHQGCRRAHFSVANTELTAHPERTAKAAFEHLQERYPGVFPATQVRTLQRRVQEWRMRTILAFDDQWLGKEVLVRRSLPLPLREIGAGRAAGGRGKINDEATAAAG